MWRGTPPPGKVQCGLLKWRHRSSTAAKRFALNPPPITTTFFLAALAPSGEAMAAVRTTLGRCSERQRLPPTARAAACGPLGPPCVLSACCIAPKVLLRL